MFLVAAYPDAIAAAQARSKRFREQSSLTETILGDHSKLANRTSCRPRVANKVSSSQVRDVHCGIFDVIGHLRPTVRSTDASGPRAIGEQGD